MYTISTKEPERNVIKHIRYKINEQKYFEIKTETETETVTGGGDVVWGYGVWNIFQPVQYPNPFWVGRTIWTAVVSYWDVIWLTRNNETNSPAGLHRIFPYWVRLVSSTLNIMAKEETPNPDFVVFVIISHRLSFIGPSCEEDGGRLVRVWRGWYCGPPGLGLPVLPSEGPNNISYDLRG